MRLPGFVRAASPHLPDQGHRGRSIMLRILGSPKTLCSGWTRREMLQAGALSLFGLDLPDFSRLQAPQASPAPATPHRTFGRAKACILLYLYGAPSQLE